MTGMALPAIGMSSTSGLPSSSWESADFIDSPQGGPPARLVKLGRTNLKVTPLLFGSMITSDPTVIQRACDLGINYFSSARDYQNGNNERLLGTALKGKRQRIYLATETLDLTLPGRTPQSQETTQYVLEQLHTSLKELGTDYVDIWLFHNKNAPEYISDQLLEAVQTVKKQGKIRYAGVTTHKLPAIADFLAKNEELDIVMPIFNFTRTDQTMQKAIEKVHQAGLGVIAMKVMVSGLRTGNPLPQMKRAGGLNAALKWAINHPHVDAAITSMTDIDQLENNLKCINSPYTAEDKQLLSACLQHISSEYCRMCGNCEGMCRMGMPVADVLRYGAYARGYGQFDLGRQKFQALPQELQDVRCELCPNCTVRCQYGIQVATHLAEIQELFAEPDHSKPNRRICRIG
jgi:uncharacterized protein